MGKGRVWNRGKHDGTGLSRKKPVEQVGSEATEQASSEASIESSEDTFNARLDTVKPMNRTNWVTRPKRVVNKDNKSE